MAIARAELAFCLRDLDGDAGRVGGCHCLVLQWNRDVVLPSPPEEPTRHGAGGRGVGGRGEAADFWHGRDSRFWGWRERRGSCRSVAVRCYTTPGSRTATTDLTDRPTHHLTRTTLRHALDYGAPRDGLATSPPTSAFVERHAWCRLGEGTQVHTHSRSGETERTGRGTRPMSLALGPRSYIEAEGRRRVGGRDLPPSSRPVTGPYACG
jgi:hypothetical protein